MYAMALHHSEKWFWTPQEDGASGIPRRRLEVTLKLSSTINQKKKKNHNLFSDFFLEEGLMLGLSLLSSSLPNESGT